MRKKMAASFGIWCLIFVALVVISLQGEGGMFTVPALVFWTVIPFLSWGMNQYVKRKITASVTLEPTAFKGRESRGVLTLENKSFCLAGRVFAELTVQNRLTGEVSLQYLKGSVPASGKTQIPFQIVSKHCGYLEVTLTKLIVNDWFGFLPAKIVCGEKGKISVLPDMFEPTVTLSVSPAYASDSESWAESRKGSDYTEVFALREYVQGDSLKQIHWKLSAKKDQLIVREGSYPTARTLLLFWDKNTAKADGQEMDAMAEIVSSISQEISRQGVAYVLAWTEGRECVSEEINSVDELLQAIPRMIKTGASAEEASGAALWSEQYEHGDYGKAVYFGKTLPEDFVPLSAGDMTYILKEEASCKETGRCIGYRIDSYMQDLQYVEL